jgi:hypothetical protein
LFSVVETLQGQLKKFRKIWIADKPKKILNLCKKKKDTIEEDPQKLKVDPQYNKNEKLKLSSVAPEAC